MRYVKALVLVVFAVGGACAVADPATECLDAFGKRDFDTAVAPCTKAAEQGHAKAQYNLGVMYDIGNGVPEDDAKAVEWYSKAAEQGHAKAQYELGTMYYHGYGVLEDQPGALVWFTRAAEKGHVMAMEKLARENYMNELVAHMWWNIAAAHGERGNQYGFRRDDLEANMTAEEISEAQRMASEWIEKFKATEDGD